MPSKQQQEEEKQQQQAAAAAGVVKAVEELVQDIKENLRLKATTSRSGNRSSSRPSPYQIPTCRLWTTEATDRQLNCNNDDQGIDDPYELLQKLLKSNNLVKEAVRRLQLNLSPKQRYFYDSDEESRSPAMIRMCQLEL